MATGRTVARRRSSNRSASPARLIGLLIVVLLLFGAMGARLVVLQVVDRTRYLALAADQREREIVFPARRGVIFDRNGEPLAISVDLQLLFADPAHVKDPRAGAKALAKALGGSRKEYERALRGAPDWSRYEVLAHAVQPKIARRIKRLELPGVYARPEPRRLYPNGSLASQIIGFVNFDGKGSGGVELAFEDVLSGRPGSMTLEQDPDGRAMLQAEFTYERPRPGRSLFLTIDKELQYFTELELERSVRRYNADGGTAIVMRATTGEILALANLPDFDPNHYTDAKPPTLTNSALTNVYEPGSAFKIVTAAGALEEGVVSPKTRFVVPDSIQVADRVFNDSHSHQTERMSVSKIVEQSSNVGMIQIGQRLGGAKLEKWIRRFGFGTRTGLGLPAESPGIVPARADWSGSTMGTLPIGQGIAVTPLQMALAYATLANRGRWVEPKLLYGTLNDEGHLHQATAPSTRQVLTESTARRMRSILTRVVAAGTGIAAQIPGYSVAGKTGTAQKVLPSGGYGNSYISSFAGFAPADKPALVTLVVLDEPRPIWGGATAAPAFKTIMEFALRHLGIAPTGNAEKAARAIASQAVEPTHD